MTATMLSLPEKLTPLENEIWEFVESSIEISINDPDFKQDNPGYEHDLELQLADVNAHVERFCRMSEDAIGADISRQKFSAICVAGRNLIYKVNKAIDAPTYPCHNG
jgi:hypothetical protein|tara:strand:- start:1331 stop:1651 length:321 start_codon:yes stop_codon:yes gene_type:complete